MASQNQERMYFQDLLDRAKESAFSRGAKHAGWSDVWASAIDTQETSNVLSSRGLDPYGFKTELHYIEKFKQQGFINNFGANPQQIQEATAEIIQDLQNYMQLASLEPVEGTTEDLAAQLVEIIQTKQNEALSEEEATELRSILEKLKTIDPAQQTEEEYDAQESPSIYQAVYGRPQSEVITQIIRLAENVLGSGISDQHENAILELADLLETIKAQSLEGKPDNSNRDFTGYASEMYNATEQLASFIALKLELSEQSKNKQSDPAKEALKEKIIKTVASTTFGQMFRLVSGGADKQAAQMIQAQFAQAFFQELMMGAGHDVSSDISDDIDAAAELETIQSHPAIPPSPVNVIEELMVKSSEVYKNLLLRNGMRTTDADAEDILESHLPSRAVQRVMLNGLSQTYALNAIEMTSRHIVLGLLADNDVQKHLTRLGIEDLSKFEQAFKEHSVSMDTKPKGRFSVHPTVPDDIKEYASALDTEYKAHFRAADMLLFAYNDNPALAEAMEKAGLTEDMVGQWIEKYPKDSEENKAEEEHGFKVHQQELDELIGTYCQDYTQMAKDGKFDPMIGQDEVLDTMTTILLKRGKKNPTIIGEPGTGKSKVLEGLSNAIVAGTLHEDLIGARLLMLDLAQMDDSPYKGMFESRILPIIKGVAERNASGKYPPILLGIDELAVAKNAGTHSGDPNGFQGMIKPYLTNGDIFLISTTTEDEYRTQIETDPAFARRMQPVFVKIPTDEQAAEILAGLKESYEKHHHVAISDDMISEVTKLAGRYIHTVNHPDKAIDLLDESCARSRKAGEKELKREHVLQAVSDKTNIPYEFLSQSEKQRYREIGKNLGERVLGQDEAIDMVSGALKRAKAKTRKSKGRPIGNFLFVGPTGVGKTELTKALAEFLMGDEEEFLVRFDMSEYQEKQSVSRFIGSPPGYVGYEEGGGLVKAVRAKPFAVYLYDEVEKAHPDVFNSLLAPLSDGIVTDGRGIKGNMRDTINIMTSNLGAKAVRERGEELGLDPVEDYEAWQAMALPIYKQAVETFFPPEFLGRLDGVVYFNSLSPDVIKKLVSVQEAGTKSQMKAEYGLDFELSNEFRNSAAKQGYDVRFGARPLEQAWKAIVEDPLADFLLEKEDEELEDASKLRMVWTSSSKGIAAAKPADKDVTVKIEGNDEDAQKVIKVGTPQFVLKR